MKKMICLLLAVFMFFGCASTDSETSSEIPEIVPVESEVQPENQDLTDNLEENLEIEQDKLIELKKYKTNDLLFNS